MAEKEIKITTKHIVLFGIIFLIVGGFFVLGNGDSENKITGNAITGEVQNVKVSMVGNEYIFEPAVIKQGVPTRLEVDMDTVFGCYRDIVLPNLGVKKYVSEGDNIIEFVPNKAGNSQVSCSMGMGSGTLRIE